MMRFLTDRDIEIVATSAFLFGSAVRGYKVLNGSELRFNATTLPGDRAYVKRVLPLQSTQYDRVLLQGILSSKKDRDFLRGDHACAALWWGNVK